MVEIFVPRPSDPPPEGTDAYGVAWVTVQHPGLGATHRIPADALDGFRESGWGLVLPQKGDPVKTGQFLDLSAPSNDQPAAVDNDDTSKE